MLHSVGYGQWRIREKRVLLCCLHEGATVPVTRPREEGFQFQTSHGMNGKTGVPISRTQQKPYIIINLGEGGGGGGGGEEGKKRKKTRDKLKE